MPRLSAEQLAARRHYIGASDIAAIAGLNPYKDAVDVLNSKLGFAEERPEDEEQTADWGQRLEPLVRAWYVETQGVTLAPCGSVRHPTIDWAGATLDSKIVGASRGLEIKIVGHRVIYDWDTGDDDGVPHYVRAQCAWQMWVCSLEEIDVPALLGGTRARIWRVKRDAELEGLLVAKGEEFWRANVLEKRAPALTGSDSVRTYLDGKYPPPPAPVRVDADAQIGNILDAREGAKIARDAGESLYRSTTASAIAWLGERNATDVVGDGWEFRFRVRKDGTRQPWFQRKGDK